MKNLLCGVLLLAVPPVAAADQSPHVSRPAENSATGLVVTKGKCSARQPEELRSSRCRRKCHLSSVSQRPSSKREECESRPIFTSVTTKHSSSTVAVACSRWVIVRL